MNTRVVVVVLVFLAVAGLAVGGYVDFFNPPEDANADSLREISVSGTGTVQAEPDEAFVTLAVVTEAKDAATAQQDNAEKMQKVIKAVKSLGIPAKDIRTIGLSLNPIYSYEKCTTGKCPDTRPQITGYRASNQVEIRIRDTSLISDVLDEGVKAGANSVQGVRFALSEDKQREYRLEAVKEAAGKAEADAKALAEALGVTLLKPLRASTSSIYQPYIVPRPFFEEVAVSEMRAATPIEKGEVTVTAQVQVVYEFK